MPAEIEFHPEAIVEARAAREWYAERSETAAAALAVEIDRAGEMIADAPTRWATFEYGTRRFLLRRFPYAVIYRATSECVTIVAFAHCRRRPGYWKKR